MKVWELMAELSKVPAGVDVWIGTGGTFNVPLEKFEHEQDGDEHSVSLTSSAVAESTEF